VDSHEKLYRILDRNPRYPLAAYAAIHEGLDFTVRSRNVNGHVDGEELALGMAAYLKDKFGPYARMVLDGWGVH